MRWLVLAHRYLGVAVGALMLGWCLSGAVMIYVSYPELSEARRLGALEPLSLTGCCAAGSLASDETVEAFDVEMLAGRPVARLRRSDPGTVVIDLVDGHALESVGRELALSVAARFARGAASGPTVETIEYDQWTVWGVAEADRPLHRVALHDDAGTELYVSSRTGAAVQVTTARERFWSRLGAVLHWLYFSELRRHRELWTEVVVWTSLLGTLLAASGLVIGVARVGPGASSRVSPYRGLLYWHHAAGLAFGLFTLTWIASGLLSMNPWGLLASEGTDRERAAVEGPPPTAARVKDALAALARAPLPPGVTAVGSVRLAGEVYLVPRAASGSRARLDAAGAPAPLTSRDTRRIAGALTGDPEAVVDVLAEEDDYHFGLHETAPLPVLRVVARDEDRTRYYLDPISGALLRKVDGGARRYRWLHEALHRLDFTAALRARPLWDAVVLVLLAGVTTVCATGALLGARRLLRRPAPR